LWRFATNTPREIVTDYSLPNNHILHTLLVHSAQRIGGISPTTVRIPAYIAGMALVPAMFLTFGRIAGRLSGLLGAALVAGSSVLVGFSANARGYTLAGLLAVAAIGVAFEMGRDAHGIPITVALAAVGALGIWTVPVFLYAWAPVLLWLAISGGEKDWWLGLRDAIVVGGLSIGGAALLYSPALAEFGLESLIGNRFVESDSWVVFFEETPQFLGGVWVMWSHKTWRRVSGLR